MYDFLLVWHCNYGSNLYIVPFSSYLTLNNIVTLKSVLEAGHSRSVKLVPFESLAVSYSSSIVTVAVSVAACEIFSFK